MPVAAHKKLSARGKCWNMKQYVFHFFNCFLIICPSCFREHHGTSSRNDTRSSKQADEPPASGGVRVLQLDEFDQLDLLDAAWRRMVRRDDFSFRLDGGVVCLKASGSCGMFTEVTEFLTHGSGTKP